MHVSLISSSPCTLCSPSGPRRRPRIRLARLRQAYHVPEYYIFPSACTRSLPRGSPARSGCILKSRISSTAARSFLNRPSPTIIHQTSSRARLENRSEMQRKTLGAQAPSSACVGHRGMSEPPRTTRDAGTTCISATGQYGTWRPDLGPTVTEASLAILVMTSHCWSAHEHPINQQVRIHHPSAPYQRIRRSRWH